MWYIEVLTFSKNFQSSSHEFQSSVFLVTSCPKSTTVYEKMLSKKCQQKNVGISNIPIYDKTTLVSYRNIFCALCHKIDLSPSKISAWNATLNTTCEDEYLNLGYTKHEIQTKAYCHTIFLANSFISDCPYDKSLTIVKTCTINSNVTLVEMCEMLATSLLYIDEQFFKNRYCAMCNGIENITTTACSRIDVLTVPQL